MKGWVYIISNKAMPNLVKVGFSMKDPMLRANELNNTGAPHPYTVEYEILVENPRDFEQATHQKLMILREGKEWFRCSVESAVAALKEIIGNDFHAEKYHAADRIKTESLLKAKSDALKLKELRSIEEKKSQVEREKMRRRNQLLNEYKNQINMTYEEKLKKCSDPIVVVAHLMCLFFLHILMYIPLVAFNIINRPDALAFFVFFVFSGFIYSLALPLGFDKLINKYALKKSEESKKYQFLKMEYDKKLSELRHIVPCLKCNKLWLVKNSFSWDGICTKCGNDTQKIFAEFAE